MTLQVFISYKSQERSFAEQLRDQLRAWGFSTWLDKDNIPEGAYFRHEIQKGLETSQVVIGLLTEEALQSREVMWEWDYALDKSRLIPVMLRPCELPYHLRSTQYLDFTQPDPAAYDRLRQAITSPVGVQHVAPNPPIPKSQPQTSASATDRARMLDKVHEFWVVGVLENALKESGTFELGLSAVPGAVLKHIDYGDYQLPSTAGIGEVFNDLNRELLILGAPGAGKTILLLQLARHLIERTRMDETQPIPVVFNLSSWAAERKPLEDWLVSELRLKYQVPKKVAQEWVEYEKLLLLLDGLDEVAEEFRNACVHAINAFHHKYTSVDHAICSRIADYQLLTSKLDLSGAIVLNSLSTDQINTYLNRPELEGLRTVLPTDSVLQEMAQIPFLLNMMAYAYKNLSPLGLRIPQVNNPNKERRNHLFDTYVEKRLNVARALVRSDPPSQTRYYLNWLAQKMLEFGQTVFHIEELHAKWLNSSRRQIISQIMLQTIIIVILTLFISISLNFTGWTRGTIHGTLTELAFGISGGLSVLAIIYKKFYRYTKFIIGIVFGSALYIGFDAFYSNETALLVGIGGGSIAVITLHIVGNLTTKRTLPDRDKWSTETITWSVNRIIFGVIVGSVLGGLMGAMAYFAVNGTEMPRNDFLLSSLFLGMIVGFGAGMVIGISLGIKTGKLSVKNIPNQGVWLSGRNALSISFVVGWQFPLTSFYTRI